MTPHTRDRLLQTKLNALTAKKYHGDAYSKWRVFDVLTKSLAILVPLFYLAPLYYAKGTAFEQLVQVTGTALSFILLGLSITYLLLKTDDRIQGHRKGIHDNIYLASEVDTFVRGNPSDKSLEWFFKYALEVDSRDKEAFPRVQEKLRKATYREALKELYPGNATIACPVCNTPVWRFRSGNCQLCGGTHTLETDP